MRRPGRVGRSGKVEMVSVANAKQSIADADVVILSACDTAGMATIGATREAGITTGISASLRQRAREREAGRLRPSGSLMGALRLPELRHRDYHAPGVNTAVGSWMSLMSPAGDGSGRAREA